MFGLNRAPSLMKRMIISILLLFLPLRPQFFRGSIPFPEDSPGVIYPIRVFYNHHNNKLYLGELFDGLAVLDGTTLQTIKRINFLGDWGEAVWVRENNRFYLPGDNRFTNFSFFFVFDCETDSLIDSVMLNFMRLLPQGVIYNEGNNRIYINEYYFDTLGRERGHIIVLDGQNHRILDTINTFGIPSHLLLNPNNGHLYASCRKGVYGESLYYCLNIIDLETNQILDTTIRGKKFFPYFDRYGDLFFNSILNKFYLNANTEILVIDALGETLLTRINAGRNGKFLFNPRRNKLYISNGGFISIIDCFQDSVIKIIQRRGPVDFQHLAACNERENKVYVVVDDTISFYQENLIIIDGETDSIIEEIRFFERIEGISFDNNHNRLYLIENRGIPTLDVIDGRSNQIVETIVTGAFLTGTIIWNPLNNKLYVGLMDNPEDYHGHIVVIDGESHRFIKDIPVDWHPLYFTFNTRRNKIYCGSEGMGVIAVIDGERDTITNFINLGSQVGRLEYNAVNNKIYCANWRNGLAVIDGEGDTLITYVSLPFPPWWTLLWTPDLNKVYCGLSEQVAVIDGATNRILRIVPSPITGAYQCSYAYNKKNKKLYITYYNVPHQVGIGIFDCLSDTFIKFYRFSDFAWGTAWSEQNNKVYFSVDGGIGVIDGETDSLLRYTYIPAAIYDLIWNPENNKVYGVLDIGGMVVIDCETDSILQITGLRDYNYGDQPLALNLENDRVYLASEEKSRIFFFTGEEIGINNPSAEKLRQKIMVYPNPAKGLIKIVSHLEGRDRKIKIYDVLGRLVKDLSPLKERGEILLSPANFPFSSGVYILRVETEKKSFLHKFIWLR